MNCTSTVITYVLVVSLLLTLTRAQPGLRYMYLVCVCICIVYNVAPLSTLASTRSSWPAALAHSPCLLVIAYYFVLTTTLAYCTEGLHFGAFNMHGTCTVVNCF